MRSLILSALVTCLSCLVVSQAAASTMRLTYIGGSTAQAGTGGTRIDVNPNDLLSFDISAEVDAAGLATLAFGLSWFDDSDAMLVSTSWASGTIFTSFAPLTTALLNTPPLHPASRMEPACSPTSVLSRRARRVRS